MRNSQVEIQEQSFNYVYHVINTMFGKEKKIRGKKMSGFLFSTSMFGWNENERKENRIISIFLVCLCRKVKEKKKIIMPNNNFTLMSL